MHDPEPARLRDHRIDPADIDRDARRVLRRLNDSGFHAYLVGGSVRDLLLDRTPKDFDVATSARPMEVRRLFRRCRLIGRRFRLAHIIGEGGKIIETATFRAKPAGVDGEGSLITDDNQFGTPHSDAHRRDFTVNALFYDLSRHEVIDYVDGLRDLDARILRTIGEPIVRFREDPVRMLRAVKFAGRLDFSFEPEMRAAILAERGELQKAALPRLYEELRRLMWNGASARCVRLLDDTRQLELMLPELVAWLGRPTETPWQHLEGLLEALDDRYGSPEPPDGLLFAPLFWPPLCALIDALPHRPGPADEVRLAEALIEPFARRLTVPRRTVETLLRVLGGQRRLERINGTKSAMALARDPDYAAIIAFARMRADAGELDPTTLEILDAQVEDYPPPPVTRFRGRPRRRPRRRPDRNRR